MLANDVEPILGSTVIDELLERAQVTDALNQLPQDLGYTPTYDLNRAAARGWRLKAARVAADYDLDVSGKALSRSQMVAQLLQLASSYARLGGPRSFALDRNEPRLVPWEGL